MTFLQGVFAYLVAGFVLSIVVGLIDRSVGTPILRDTQQVTLLIVFLPVLSWLAGAVILLLLAAYPFAILAKLIVWRNQSSIKIERPMNVVEPNDEQWRNPN